MIQPLRSIGVRARCSRCRPSPVAVVLAPTPAGSRPAGATHRTGSRDHSPRRSGCGVVGEHPVLQVVRPLGLVRRVGSQGEPHHPAVADGAAGGVVPVALLVLGVQGADDAPAGVVVAGGDLHRAGLDRRTRGQLRPQPIRRLGSTTLRRSAPTSGAWTPMVRMRRSPRSPGPAVSLALRVSPSETDSDGPLLPDELVVGGRHGRVARRRPEQQPENPDRDPRAAKALPHAPPLPLIGIGAIPPSRTGSMLTGRSPVPSHPRSPPRRRTGPRCPRASPRRRRAGSPARCRARSSPGRRRLRAGGSVRPCPCRRSG